MWFRFCSFATEMIVSPLTVSGCLVRWSARDSPAPHFCPFFYRLQFALPLLIIQLVLILAVSRLIHFFLRPMRQPRVIAEILVNSHSLISVWNLKVHDVREAIKQSTHQTGVELIRTLLGILWHVMNEENVGSISPETVDTENRRQRHLETLTNLGALVPGKTVGKEMKKCSPTQMMRLHSTDNGTHSLLSHFLSRV